MEGIFNIDKPAGLTSFRVVATVRRLSGEKRAGHTGTLDPDATGVLPVCVGQATRIAEYLVDTPKTYRAGIELGVTTDTYDSAGTITDRRDPSDIDRGKVEKTLEEFRGDIRQTPPMYSALKHHGRPLYRLARAGVTVARRPRRITISRLEITDWRFPSFTIEVECGKGTYIRSLAHDLGQALGCGAYLKCLERTRCGIFDIRDAVTLPAFEEALRSGEADRYLLSIDSALKHLASVTFDATQEKAIRNGQPLFLGEVAGDDATSSVCRAYRSDGRFIAILRRESQPGWWRPKKVFG